MRAKETSLRRLLYTVKKKKTHVCVLTTALLFSREHVCLKRLYVARIMSAGKIHDGAPLHDICRNTLFSYFNSHTLKKIIEGDSHT